MTQETVRELLELAATAAGITIDKSEYNGGGRGNTGFDVLGNLVTDWHNGTKWNPLTDDGDALRLAVKLRMEVRPYTRGVDVLIDGDLVGGEPFGTDRHAATRLAIVRTAAEIGRNME